MPKKPTKTPKGLTTEKLASLIKPVFVEQEAEVLSPVKELEKLGLKSPLIVAGEETLRTRRLIDWLKKICFEKEDGSLKAQFNSYYAGDLTSAKKAKELAISFGNLDLFSSEKVVIINEADKVKSTVAQPLIDALSKPHSDSLVILEGKKINNQTPLLNHLSKVGTVIAVENLDDKKLARWIQREAKQSGAQAGVEAAVVRLLIDSYGSDLFALSQQIAKLALLTSDDGLISRETASEIVFKSPELQSFELLDSISAKNSLATIKKCEELVAQGMHPLQISSFLGRSFRIMLALKSATNASDLGKDLANPWFAKRLRPASNKLSEKKLKAQLKQLTEMDQKLKGSPLPPETILANTLTAMLH